MNDADTEYRITQLETLLAYAEDAATKGRLARENAAGMEMQIAELQTAHSDLSIEFDRLKLTLVELRNENEQLRQIGNDAIAETSKLRHELVELWKDHKSLKSWKESIRAEVGSEPSPRGYSNEYEYMSALEQHYRHRAEHLAARLVELRSCKAVLRGAIEKTLRENGHLADGDNCTLIDLKQALAGQPAPSAAQIDDAISGTRVDVAPLPLGGEQS